MKVPFHVKLRRKIKDFFDKALLYFSTPAVYEKIDKSQVKNILVIRINYRIGNMLFTTPLLKQLQEEFPDAKIDLLIGAPFTKVLFTGFKNIENIYDFDKKLLKNPLQALRYIKQLRSKKYDVVLNINGGSTSDRLATLLSKAPYKVSFCDPVSYTPTNRCVPREDTDILHEGLKPLELLKIFGVTPNYDAYLTVELSKEELEEGKAQLEQLVGADKKVFAIFRNARFEKIISDEYWRELVYHLKQKEPELVFVDILSPDIPHKLQEDMIEYSNKNLRKLAAFMANLDAFICGDTGPMHLASASGVSTIALFKNTPPLLYGTLKKNDLSLEINNLSTQEVADAIVKHLAHVQE